MQASNEQILLNEFPVLYREAESIKRYREHGYVFECEDGWFQIIYDLSKVLENILEALPNPQDWNYPCATVIKEKFGELRLNLSAYPPGSQEAIDAATMMSRQTCEVCGQAGRTYWNLPWVRTLCAEHYSAKVEEYTKQGQQIKLPNFEYDPREPLKYLGEK